MQSNQEGVKTECVRLHRVGGGRGGEGGDRGFKASCGWLNVPAAQPFQLPTTDARGAKKQTVIDDRSQGFLRLLIRLRQRRNYHPTHIGNMDETRTYIDTPGNYTLEITRSKTITMVSTGHEKECLTVMLAAMADGTKLAPMVLLKVRQRTMKFPQASTLS